MRKRAESTDAVQLLKSESHCLVFNKIWLHLLRIPLLPLRLQLVKFIPAFNSLQLAVYICSTFIIPLKNVSFASLWTTEQLVKLLQAVFNKANMVSDIFWGKEVPGLRSRMQHSQTPLLPKSLISDGISAKFNLQF